MEYVKITGSINIGNIGVFYMGSVYKFHVHWTFKTSVSIWTSFIVGY